MCSHCYSDFGDECLLPKQGSFLKLIEIKEAYNKNSEELVSMSSCSCMLGVSIRGKLLKVLPLKINNSYSTDETIYSDLDICIYFDYFLQPLALPKTKNK